MREGAYQVKWWRARAQQFDATLVGEMSLATREFLKTECKLPISKCYCAATCSPIRTFLSKFSSDPYWPAVIRIEYLKRKRLLRFFYLNEYDDWVYFTIKADTLYNCGPYYDAETDTKWYGFVMTGEYGHWYIASFTMRDEIYQQFLEVAQDIHLIQTKLLESFL